MNNHMNNHKAGKEGNTGKLKWRGQKHIRRNKRMETEANVNNQKDRDKSPYKITKGLG